MQVDAAILSGLVPLNALHPEHRRQLAGSANVIVLDTGEVLGEEPGAAEPVLYLLEGEVVLGSGERVLETVTAGASGARFPLAPVAPNGPVWRAAKPARILRIDAALMNSLLIWMQSAMDADEAQARRALFGGQTARWVYRLLSSPLFARIPATNIRSILEIMEPVEVRAGNVVVRQGDPGNYYYVIRSGRCAVTRASGSGGAPVTLAELAEGDSFGEEALVADALRNASVTMLTDGSLMRLTKNDFLELVREPVLSAIPWRDAETLGDEGARWLDVRLPEEHEHYSVDGSINVPLTALRQRLGDLDRAATYIVYSNTGRRSSVGAFVLMEHGFDAHVLELGLARGRDPAPFRPPQADANRTATSGKGKGPSDPARLKAALAEANAQLERALQDKCEATAARRYWSDPARKEDGGSRGELSRRVKMLEMRSASASKALSEAQRRKLEVEAAMRNAEAEAARHRAHAEAACERLREQTEERLHEEEQRLQQEYARAAETIEQLKSSRQAAEKRVQEERQRIEEEFNRSQQELSEAAQRVRADMENAKQAAAERAERIRSEHAEQEQQLRSEAESKLLAERKRLEEQFVESLARLEKARQSLERSESERRRAEQQAAKLSEELRTAEAERRAQSDARYEEQRERLEAEASRAAEALRTAEAAVSGDEASRSAVEAAQQDVESVARQRTALDEQYAQHRAAEEELRVQLLDEAEAFARQERTESEAEVTRIRSELESADSARRAEASRPEPVTTADPSDVLPEIDKDVDPAEARARMAFANERVVLTRWAEQEAQTQREKAKEALQRAREHIERLKRQGAPGSGK